MKRIIFIAGLLLIATTAFGQTKQIEHKVAGRTQAVLEANLQSGAILPLANLRLYSETETADTLINLNGITAKPFTDNGSGVALTNGISGASNTGLVFVHNDSLSIAYDADFVQSTGSWTFSAFVKHGSVSSTIDILFTTYDNDSTGILVFLDDADDKIKFVLSDSTAFAGAGADTLVHTDATSLVGDTWVYIAIVYDTTGATNQMRIQINDTEVSGSLSAQNNESYIGDADARLIIGNGSFLRSTSLLGWDGEMSEISFWDAALTKAQRNYLRQRGIFK